MTDIRRQNLEMKAQLEEVQKSGEGLLTVCKNLMERLEENEKSFQESKIQIERLSKQVKDLKLQLDTYGGGFYKDEDKK